jgi:hypothetical protein
MRFKAARLWRLIGRVQIDQVGCWLGADSVAKRCRGVIAMTGRTCEVPGEATRASVRLWATLPQRQHWTGRSGNRVTHV